MLVVAVVSRSRRRVDPAEHSSRESHDARRADHAGAALQLVRARRELAPSDVVIE